MTSRRSTARSRDIGLELLAIREKAGYDGQGLANRLGWDQSKVSRIEGGKQAIDEVDLIHWLSTCNVKRARLRQLVDHNREATQDTWVRTYGPLSYTIGDEERHARNLYYAGWKKITIRVLSAGLAYHHGANGCFSMIKGRDGRKVVHVDTHAVSIFLEDPDHVALYEASWKELGEIALSAEESVEFIRKVAGEWAAPDGRTER